MDKQAQDQRWQALTEDGRQARIASYKELLKLQREEANSYLITIEDLEKLYGKHNLHPQQLTYEDVARELFENGELYWITENGYIGKKELNQNSSIIKDANNCTSRKQAEKLLAINRLLNIAKFLNGKDWKPDEAEGKLWAIGIEKYNKTIMPVEVGAYDYRTEIVYFRTEELAKQAVQILGEDTVRLALSSDF